ncbi:BatD family protein [Aestuariibacter sp. A3R04]|uniref:BatD family protein n=1 Tax=Aestuariibacter sp. A3R04 TaxID=2841571 RepID=UPI001C084C7B|nr:BatD family protein [Aestuariibacter sp. A3R04]MBU3022395.1 BatD family protein [Aestuariibacter sp. A3R04]
MKRFYSILSLLICLSASSAFADVERVEATIDKNPVMVDEAIQLTVVAHGDPERDAFDSSPLLKDFVVGRTSVSTQTRIINFDKEETTTWTTTLFPRGEGNFTIPALTVEGKQTRPITVNVIPVTAGSAKTARDYYVTTDIDTHQVYLQQQLLYTAKLYLATNIERGSLQAPELEGAQIQQLGDDKQYTDIVNGKRYQVIERTFAVVPQASGTFTLRGPVFSGEVMVNDPNARFGFFNRTKQINRLGPDITITVKPIPADIDYPWLPSEYVTLNEEWPQPDAFTVGEPITRTITLTAMGVVEEQLPALPQHYPPSFKLYPDQANTATVNKNHTLIAQRVESLAMIPTQPGNVVLPEITVPWFNVLTGQTEYATLPARSISVLPAADAPANQIDQIPQPLTASDNGNIKTPASEASPITAPPTEWHRGLTWSLLAVWILTLIGWGATVLWYRKRQSSTIPASTDSLASHQGDETQRFTALTKAIEVGTAGQIQQALASWLATRFPNATDCSRPDNFPDTACLQPQIDVMLSSQYGNAPSQWDRKGLLKRVNEVRSQLDKHSTTSTSLPPLYPEGLAS